MTKDRITRAEYVKRRADLDGDGKIEGEGELWAQKLANEEFDALNAKKDDALDRHDVAELARASGSGERRARNPKQLQAPMDAELKREAKSVIDRIVNLRDSL